MDIIRCNNLKCLNYPDFCEKNKEKKHETQNTNKQKKRQQNIQAYGNEYQKNKHKT